MKKVDPNQLYVNVMSFQQKIVSTLRAAKNESGYKCFLEMFTIVSGIIKLKMYQKMRTFIYQLKRLF